MSFQKSIFTALTVFFVIYGLMTTDLSEKINFTVKSNVLLPIRLIFTTDGVLYEIEREWTTPLFSFGFETELPAEKFYQNQLIIVIHNDSWPKNYQYQAFGIDLKNVYPIQWISLYLKGNVGLMEQ